MRRWFPMLVLLVSAACRGTPSGPPAGASTAQGAVVQFLSAARAQDLQAMSAVWGNETALVRDTEGRQELERRLLILNCHLRHDESRIGPPQMGEAGRTLFRVELKKGTTNAATVFKTVRNRRSGLWFVEDFDLKGVRDLCDGITRPGGATPDR